MRRLRRVSSALPFLFILLLHFPSSSTAARLRIPSTYPIAEKQVTIVGANLPPDIQVSLQEAFGAQSVQAAGGDSNLSDESTNENVDLADTGDGGQSDSSQIVGPVPIENPETAGEGQPGEQDLDTDVFLDIKGNTQQADQEDTTVEPSAEVELEESSSPEGGFPILVVVEGSIETSSTDQGGSSQQEAENPNGDINGSEGEGASNNRSVDGTETTMAASGQLVQPSASPVAPRVESTSIAGSSATLGSSSDLQVPAQSLQASTANSPLQSPSKMPSPTPLAEDISIVDESPMPSSDALFEDGVWVEIPLTISDTAGNQFSDKLDSSIRTRGAEVSGTSVDSWVLVDISNGTVDTRKTSGGPGPWLVIYHALFPEEKVTEGVARLVENVSNGSFDEYLRDTTGETLVTTRIAADPILNVMPGTEFEDIAPGPSNNSAVSSEEGKVEKSNEKDTPTDEEASRSFAVILGTAFGGIALFIVALVGFGYFKRRTKPYGHTLDGIPGVPTSISSLDSSDDGSSRYETGAPLQPRGAHVLRDQSRILDWQLEHVEATGVSGHETGRSRRDTIESPELSMVRDGTFGNSGEVSSSEVVK